MEKLATFGLMSNMTLYLIKQYHMEIRTASNLLFFWSATTTSMPLAGALIADSFLGRFHTIGFGSLICLLVVSLSLAGALLFCNSVLKIVLKL